MRKDLKYLAAYLIPLTALIAITVQGIWSYSTVLFAFVLIPILEVALPTQKENLEETERAIKAQSRFFDWLLYLNLPINLLLLGLFFYAYSNAELMIYERVGLILSVGILLGASGINVAHELGHRQNKTEQLLAQLLLLPELYMHFFIEHNQGHHKNIATDQDPASARYGEILQVFWVRSVVGGFLGAWRIESNRLHRSGRAIFSLQNRMIWFQLAQAVYLFVVYFVFGWQTLMAALLVAVIAFLLLESINYIEHYGLRRQKLPSGRYERVGVQHSWNSDHQLGRIVLYELTRHSDHHFKANKKYQILDHHAASPQLKYGYPTSVLIALVPPLWFTLMNPEVQRYNKQQLAQ